MAEFGLPESGYEWARRKGIARKCSKHKVYYDSHLGCARCREEVAAEARRNVAQRVSVLLENVVWPEVQEGAAKAKARKGTEASVAVDAELSKCPACGMVLLLHRQGTGLHECLNCGRVFEE